MAKKRVKMAMGGDVTNELQPVGGDTGGMGGRVGRASSSLGDFGSTGGYAGGSTGGMDGGGPNAPMGRGYNRAGFRGRGPVGSRMGQGDMGGMGSSIGYGPTPSVTGGPAPMTGGPLPTTTSMQPLGTPRIGFKKGGMVSKSGVSKGKHSSVTPSGGRAGGKSKACKIY